jgi:hypothetical protein
VNQWFVNQNVSFGPGDVTGGFTDTAKIRWGKGPGKSGMGTQIYFDDIVITGVGGVAPPPPALTPYEQTVASLSESDRSLQSDPDGDGLNNLTEHAFGTNPAIANATQRFTRIDPAGASGADFLLDLPSDIPTDALYTVEATCDLAADSWSSIASRDTAGNWSGTATVGEETGPEGKRRFRIAEVTEESWTCRFMRVRFHLATNP